MKVFKRLWLLSRTKFRIYLVILQHHWAIPRSCSSFSMAASSSIMGKDKNNSVSSKYDSNLQELGAKGRSF